MNVSQGREGARSGAREYDSTGEEWSSECRVKGRAKDDFSIISIFITLPHHESQPRLEIQDPQRQGFRGFMMKNGRRVFFSAISHEESERIME